MDSSDIAMRIVIPDLSVDSLIHAAGLGLINCLAFDLFSFINVRVSKELGENWLADMQNRDLGLKSVNYRDPALLFKHLALPGNPDVRAILRKPLNAVIPKNNQKGFYELVEQILGERHLWFHQQIDATPDQLSELAKMVSRVAFAVDGLPVVRECSAIFDLFQPKLSADPEEELPEPESEGAIKAIQQVSGEGETAVGTKMEGPYLPYTYTLTLSGAIKDKKAGTTLGDTQSEYASSLGALLLARKPSGGRLRITPEGQLAAFFGEGWGYLGKVNINNWFPGHLTEK